MISEGLWRRKFASDSNIVGRSITVAGEARTIIGVVPDSFQLTIQNFRASDIYEPIREDTDPQFHKRDSFWGSDAIALLNPGVTIEQAREDMKRVNAGLAATYPDVNANIKANIITLKNEMVGEIRPVLLVLLGAVIFVLFIACTNVANLLLARSTTRQREFAIRAALGAGQSRIVRQLLTESVLLALIGGALGLILARAGTAAAISLVPRTLPRAHEIAVDMHVFMFTLLISTVAGILFGLVPALRTSRTDIEQTLRTTGHSLAGVRSIRAAMRQIHSTMSNVPGVESVSLHSGARPMRSDSERDFWVDGQPKPMRQADLPTTLYYFTEPDYLPTMRIPLLRGRFFTDADNEHSARVCVVDTSFVDKYFGGQDPVVKYVHVLDYDTDPRQQTWIDLRTVGVVGHVNQWGLAENHLRPFQTQLYEPFMQS
jgi:FtsX-like permease family/MacB-like periplasmic core domain